jgi:DNA-binding CsgD family transcriptional regulator
MPYTGDIERARAASSEGLELATRTGEDRWLGTIEALSGMVAQQSGDDERAIALGHAAVARARRNGDPRTLVLATMLLIPLHRKHPDAAIEVPPIEEALQCARAAGLTLYEASLLPMMTTEAVATGDRDAALRSSIAALTNARGIAGSPLVGYTLMIMPSVAAMCNDSVGAAYFHGIVRDQITAMAQSLAPQQISGYEHMLAQTRATLGSDRFEAEAQRGSGLSWAAGVESALAYAHDAIGRFATDHALAQPAPGRSETPDRLTNRQREVLALLVSGLGNKEIAARLGVSTKTVMHHTTAIYRTLGVRGRAEAAVLAIRTGLID